MGSDVDFCVLRKEHQDKKVVDSGWYGAIFCLYNIDHIRLLYL